MGDQKEKYIIDVKGIMEIIPHRFPLLLVDRIIEINKNQSAIGIKNVTATEYFFQGHFPNEPVMPGVLIVEALAQTAAVLVCWSLEIGERGKLAFFSSIDFVKFRKPVVPGDQLILEVTLLKNKLGFFKCSGVAKVDGEIATEAEFTAKFV